MLYIFLHVSVLHVFCNIICNPTRDKSYRKESGAVFLSCRTRESPKTKDHQHNIGNIVILQAQILSLVEEKCAFGRLSEESSKD